ncbi:MAG: phosphotransferase, partial [Gaiellaceae bacterium]
AEELKSLGCHERALGELRTEAPELAPLCDRLAEHGIADSIVHGDLHHGNMLVVHDRVAVIDWSDAAIGHPFLDLAPLLRFGERQRDALVAAYVESWPSDDLRDAAAIGEALGCVYQAISYRAINAAFEPGDRWLFADQHGKWMERAHRLANRLL